MNIETAREIAIIDYLAYLGFFPISQIEDNFWYYSPFKPGSKTPTFRVNRKLNRWFDIFNGMELEGTILHFGTQYHKCSLNDFLEKLNSLSLYLRNGADGANLVERTKKKIELQIVSVDKITSPELIQFLKAKNIILELANKYLYEIELKLAETHNKLCVLGLPNESEGFQLRALNFKGSTSSDVSFIDNDACSLVVIDDMLDCLVAMQGNPGIPFPTNWLVLNGQGMNAKVDEMMLLHDEVYLLLGNDNDTSGIRKRALTLASVNRIKIVDLAPLDHNFNSISEWVFGNTQNVRSAPVSKNSREDHRRRGFRR